MNRIFLLALVLIFTLSIPQAFADDFTNAYDWQTYNANFFITMDTLKPVIGETMIISCDSRNDTSSTIMSAKLVVTNVDTGREFRISGDSSEALFHTDQLYRVECISVMNDNPSHSMLQSSTEFHPIVIDNPIVIPYREAEIPPKQSDQTDNTSDDSEKRSSGGCNDCTPPTLGYDSEGVKKVDNGICINDSCMDGGYFHTEYPMQHTTINQPNIISTIYYENGSPSNLSLVQLGIGVSEIGSTINDSQVLIEVHLDYFANDMENPSIKEIVLIDPDGIINNATAAVSLVPCMENSNTPCLKTDFSYSYGIVPTSTILMSNAIDHDNNTVNNYFNDGLNVLDNTINDTPVTDIIESTPLEPKCTTSSTQADRNNCQFKFIVKHEIERAQAYLDSLG